MPGRTPERAAAIAGGAVPGPLAEVVARVRAALARLAADGDGRRELHAIRNHLSEIAALTEPDARIVRAIERLVDAADRLGEASAAGRPGEPDPGPGLLDGALRAARMLDLSLVRARPSRIAFSVNRGW